jgi:cobalamin synthase
MQTIWIIIAIIFVIQYAITTVILWRRLMNTPEKGMLTRFVLRRSGILLLVVGLLIMLASVAGPAYITGLIIAGIGIVTFVIGMVLDYIHIQPRIPQ